MHRPLRDLGTIVLMAGLLILSAMPVWGSDRPNIILCMGDDHGWDEVGYNGHPHVKTPVLDEMAKQGLRLNRFYSGHPTCSPTRGSVLTGRHPNRYGTFAPNWSIRPEEITIAHLLRRAGYRCGHFGKWHLGPVKASSPTNPGKMGFHEWLSHDNFFEMNPILSRNGNAPARFEGESSQVIVDEAVRFIRKAKQANKPFFTVIWFGSPHEPYSGLKDDLAVYDGLLKKYPKKSVRLTSNRTGRPTRRPLGEVLRERYAEITAMDRAIGSLRNRLKKAGLRDNTLLWYCGDNGPPAGAAVTTPLRGRKGGMYEGGIRVPGIIEWPARIRKPHSTDLPAVTSDMLPTICDLLNLPLPKRKLDGISLQKLMDNQMTRRPSPLFFWSFNASREGQNRPYIPRQLQVGTTPLVKRLGNRFTRNFTNYHHPKVTDQDFSGWRVILSNEYKLLVRGMPGRRTTKQLFNLKKDQAEQRNMAKDHPQVVKRLQGELRAWQKSVLHSLTGKEYTKN